MEKPIIIDEDGVLKINKDMENRSFNFDFGEKEKEKNNNIDFETIIEEYKVKFKFEINELFYKHICENLKTEELQELKKYIEKELEIRNTKN